jgi:hypothetical protein
MKVSSIVLTILFLTAWNVNAMDNASPVSAADEINFFDSGDYDPASPEAASLLQIYDQIYESETGESPFIGNESLLKSSKPYCVREACPLWVKVVRSEQKLYLYQNSALVNGAGWATSTGGKGTGTPPMETTINGRVYNKYSSHAHPGGDYNGLGNMPYAVFIDFGGGGYAIHGTPKGNWKYLGQPASHGCVRIHPDNAVIFNQMVRNTVALTGTKRSVWISVK